MTDFESRLCSVSLAPYIIKAMALIGVCRKAGSNMFRHQVSTLGILLDYKYVDPILLKAALIHDLFEDAPGMPGVTREGIRGLDHDGPAVYELVMEVTMRMVDGVREPKSTYVTRVLRTGSERAKILKLADRISNMVALGFVHEESFVMRYLAETKDLFLPYARQINPDMHRELSDLVADREEKLRTRLARSL